jgi:hypothetical protein
MWILKNSKDLLDNLKSRSFSQVSSIKTLDFSTLYTTLSHDKLKTRLKETIHKAFSHRNNGSKFVVLGYNSTYFSYKIQKGKTCYSEEQVIRMLEFLIDNILTALSLYIFTIWKCNVYYRLCSDRIYFDKILVSEYKLFKRSNKANLLIALVQ